MKSQAVTRPKIIVLDANFSWTQNLFSSLADVADILLFYPKDFRAFKKEYGGYFIDWKPIPVSSGIWKQRICFPPGWLFHYWPITERLLTRFIRKFTGNDPMIFVFVYPYYQGIAKHLAATSLYYNMDSYREYWPEREIQTEEMEKMAVSTSDITICIAKFRATYLQKIVPQAANKVFHIPLGSSEQFILSKPLEKPKELPSTLRAYSHPIAGYIGALNYRFDFYFLSQVAQLMPEVTFVLGGKPPQEGEGDFPWLEGVKKARTLPNIIFIGYIANNELYNWLFSFDALILPYSNCDFNLNACPMKLWDYLGTSVPMVANDAVPEINLWSDIIHIATDAESFAQKLRFALDNRLWKAQERIDTAKQNTWRRQAGKLLDALQQRMKVNGL